MVLKEKKGKTAMQKSAANGQNWSNRIRRTAMKSQNVLIQRLQFLGILFLVINPNKHWRQMQTQYFRGRWIWIRPQNITTGDSPVTLFQSRGSYFNFWTIPTACSTVMKIRAVYFYERCSFSSMSFNLMSFKAQPIASAWRHNHQANI